MDIIDLIPVVIPRERLTCRSEIFALNCYYP